jgi:hypothetical protein
MNLNKMGTGVKRNIDGVLSTFLGVKTRPQPRRSKLYREIKLTENVHFDKESERISLEAEVKKSQAIELIHTLQKC